MRLTAFLLKKVAPGKIWTGKNRLVNKPTADCVQRLTKSFAIEEANMFYLRHPYLTREEAKGYSRELGKHEAWLAKVKENSIRPYRPHVRLEDRLVVALNNTNAWD